MTARSFIKKHRFLNSSAVFAVNIARFLVKIIIGFATCIEAPIFLMTHPGIFKNKIIYVFWPWSFGHTALASDYASRLYYPNRISLVYIPNPNSNDFLPLCFGHNMEVFVYKSIIPFSNVFGSPRYRIIRFILSVLSGFTARIQLIEQFNVYSTLSLASKKLFVGNEKSGKLEEAADWTGYIRLLKDGIGVPPHLPKDLESKCRNAILKIHPEFFKKPFVTLLLRKKGEDGDLSTSFRCSGPQENYRDAVKFLVEHGYFVAGTGETDHEKFRNTDGYYSFDDVGVPKSLLNLFLLVNCKLFIGQQSGPHILSDSCGILCLICDAMPYRLGTCCKDDIILFKHLKNRKTGKSLSIVDVFKNHQDLAYGYHFAEKDIEILSNTLEEILEAVKECHSIIKGEFHLSDEDIKLCDKFRRLPAEGMMICYQNNRVPLFVLHKLKNELL